MMKNDEKGLYINQIQIDVALLSFMTIVVVFFNGLLLTKFDSFDIFIKVPISFLIISTFGFLYSALILANATQKIIDGKFDKAKEHMRYGYAISEYLGIYLFVLSLPLIINVITTDTYLRVITLLAALTGLFFYQFMGFSILENHFSKTYKIFSIIIIVFGLILFIAQILSLYFIEISIIFLLFMFLITYLAPKENVQ